jgi:hypothetical protein
MSTPPLKLSVTVINRPVEMREDMFTTNSTAAATDPSAASRSPMPSSS